MPTHVHTYICTYRSCIHACKSYIHTGNTNIHVIRTNYTYRSYIHTNKHTHIHKQLCVYLHTYIHIYIYICIKMQRDLFFKGAWHDALLTPLTPLACSGYLLRLSRSLSPLIPLLTTLTPLAYYAYSAYLPRLLHLQLGGFDSGRK